MNAPNGRHAWTVTVGTKGQIVIPKEAIPPKADFARLFDLIFGGKAE